MTWLYSMVHFDDSLHSKWRLLCDFVVFLHSEMIQRWSNVSIFCISVVASIQGDVLV